ncbi:hypothetical protein C8Q76DRAFT_791816 [Earliella scabrosa]|nr:hypothetical protein C8Q76DRAFT_791816 [Earliella scabrosa]
MAAASSSASPSTDPPYYLLVAHSQSLLTASAPASTSLSHPLIEYHYADDPPDSLLPKQPGEHVLVLDYDPARPGPPTVKSLSPDLVVSAVKVTDAPGAAVAGEPALRNNSMYIIETMTKPATDMFVSPSRASLLGPTLTGVRSPTGDDDEQPVHAVLSRFKQRSVITHFLHMLLAYGVPPSGRNAVLRRILDYPNATVNGTTTSPDGNALPSANSPPSVSPQT